MLQQCIAISFCSIHIFPTFAPYEGITLHIANNYNKYGTTLYGGVRGENAELRQNYTLSGIKS